MSEKSESLNYQDVVSLTDPKTGLVLSQPTFRVSELAAAIVGETETEWTEAEETEAEETKVKKTKSGLDVPEFLRGRRPPRGFDRSQWATTGVAAEVLTSSKGWRKGKVRLTVEFIPDKGEDEPSEQ